MAKTPDYNPRCTPAFAVIRSALIHIMASGKNPVSTQEIADMLGVNRSYVIRLKDMPIKPATPAEKRIAKLAAEHIPQLQRLGFGFAFKDGLETTLAGGDRSHLENRGGRPTNASREAQAAKEAKKAAKVHTKANAKVIVAPMLKASAAKLAKAVPPPLPKAVKVKPKKAAAKPAKVKLKPATPAEPLVPVVAPPPLPTVVEEAPPASTVMDDLLT